MTNVRPLLLIVRDGWGRNPDTDNDADAVRLARTPIDHAIMHDYPSTLIATSGFDVGLPEGTMGNSEVGHQNIGAGRIVDQESVAITKQARDGRLADNPELNGAIDFAEANNGKLHLFGIVSDAGVHGQLEHLYALLAMAKKRRFSRVFLHAFTDGRDTPPSSGLGYIEQIDAKMAELGVGQIASVSGRYWAMDRDNRWARVEKAYKAISAAQGPHFKSAPEAVQHYYNHPTEHNLTGDEFITPSVMTDEHGQPRATVRTGDAIIFYNYRGDRPRELTKAFVLDEFTGFDRGPKLDVRFVTMTAYEEGLPVHVAYPKPPKMHHILGQVISEAGLKQFRCAETEKFPHVTFFFNDYRDEPFAGETRAIVPSPKTLPDGSPLATYDQFPEMGAHSITDETLAAIRSNQYALLVVNYANCDMVGHTGSFPAAVKSVEIVDECVGKLLDAIKTAGGSAIVTADHGNAEQMIDPTTGGPYTAHTTFTVPLVIVDERHKGAHLRSGGRLADIAPTALELMGLPKPTEMTGVSLLHPAPSPGTPGEG